MRFHIWWKWIAMLLLAAFIGLSISVKHDLLPYPYVRTGEMTSGYISNEYYDLIVPDDAIIEEAGKSYVYMIKPSNNYWLDSPYAYKTEIHIIKQSSSNTAIEIASYQIDITNTRKVVLNPSSQFKAIQKITL